MLDHYVTHLNASLLHKSLPCGILQATAVGLPSTLVAITAQPPKLFY